MKKYFIYLIVYSVLGFILERIINIIAYGYWYDNSVLIGPYQPLYGSGIVMAIIIYDYLISKKVSNKLMKKVFLLIVAIITTAIAEATTGFGYEYLYNVTLWNYGEFFSCKIPYVCIIPTSLFGIGSYFVISYFHPLVKQLEKALPNYLVFTLAIMFSLDIIITFFF